MPFPVIPNSISNGIGGVPFGTQGTGIYSGYTMVGGDDFNAPLNMIRAANPGGHYMNNTLIAPLSRLRSGNPRYNSDPFDTGYEDANQGVPVGSYGDTVTVLNSALSVKCRVATAAESTLSDSQANLFSGLVSIPYFTFTPPAIIEFKTKFNIKNMQGIHPTVWIRTINPANVQNGIELDICESSSQYASYNLNVWGTVAGWASGTAGTATRTVNTSMQSLTLLDGNYHTFTCILNTSGASLYVDGAFFATYSGDTTAAGAPYAAFISNVTFAGLYNGDNGLSQTAFNNAGNAGGVMSTDYIQIWLPNAQANQVIRQRTSLPTQQYTFNSAISYTFPTSDSLWGVGNYTSDYLQALRLEDYEPGGDTSGNPIYLQFPAGLTLSGRTLSGSLTGVTNKPGRINLVAIAQKAGGSQNMTANGHIDIGPTIATSTLNATQGTPFSYSLYTDCNTGTLLLKIITCTGLPSGLSYNSSTYTISGTPTTPGTTAINIQVTNLVGQIATATPNVVVASSGAATAYTLSGPSSGQVNVASTNFTVTPNGVYTGTIAPASTVAGTFTPSSLTFSSSSAAQTFTYTPSTTTGSPATVSTTSSPALTDPSGIAYTISAAPPFGLDPATPLSGSATTQTATSATFAPTYANGILVVAIQCGATGNLNTAASPSDSSSLTWTRQMHQTFTAGGDREISIWTAPFTGSYSGTVTAHLASAGVYNMRYFLTAVSDPNATVMDPNVANPVSNNSAGLQAQTAAATVVTSNANDILLALLCSNSSLGTVTRPGGFTQVLAAGTAADFSYKVVSSTQNTVETWTWTGTSDYNAIGIVAIQSA